MFLQRLIEYSKRLDLPPTLYSEAPIRYHIALDGQGRLLSREPIDTADRSSKAVQRGQRRLVPRVQRSSGIRPLLLSDAAGYTLGLVGEGANPQRVSECHEAYLAQVKRCAEATGEPAVWAVHRFLVNDPLAQLRLPPDFDAGASMTFVVGGTFVVDLPAVQAFWAAENAPDASGQGPVPIMQCIVCGETRPVLSRLQTKVKGVPGGQTTGTSIISANAEAFESYGLEASLIAPTCAACGEGFTRGINHLLADRRHHLILAGAALVFWTREQHPFSLRDWLDAPQADQVRALVEAARSGKDMPDVDQTAFYAAVLSGSGGRAVVRDWIDTTVADAKRHLADWFQRQRMVSAYGEEPRPLGIYALAAATVRDVAKDLATPVPRALWRSALTGAPLPSWLLWQALGRNRAEQGRQPVTFQRAALIKLVLCSQESDTIIRRRMEDAMTQLDFNNPNPAYLCGRLLAVLEEAQMAAIPGAKSSIVDRFYGTASSAPASVFGRLLRGVQPHLAKLQRDKPGVYRALQTRLEDVQSGLSGFPRILTLEEQGLFALGYYHQRAHDRAQAREAAARKRAGAPAETEIEITEEETQND